jgi:phage terminase Nu1 subunit (DNA packaging protein)
LEREPVTEKDESVGIVTRRGVAELFGVHAITVTKWEREGMPIHVRGARGRPSMYRMPDVITWYTERAVRARGGSTDEAPSPIEQRALLDAKRTEELDLRIRLRKGELIEAEEAARDMANVATATKARLRRVASANADRAAMKPAAVVSRIYAEAVDDALRELAARGEPEEAA